MKQEVEEFLFPYWEHALADPNEFFLPGLLALGHIVPRLFAPLKEKLFRA